MADATRYGNPVDFDVDLHSIYAAFLGLFESTSTDWWDKSWGGYFTTFNDFLGFGWEVMVVVDSATGKPHIAVKTEQIALFAKMIRTRFGESLPKLPPTTLPLCPVPTRTLSLRRLITVSDLASYRKLCSTLPAAELAYLRTRIRSGDVGAVEQLFYAGGASDERDRGGVGVRDNGVGYTWACVKTTWWEKGGPPAGLHPGSGRTKSTNGVQGGKGLVLEVGMALLRCANLRAVNVWPPKPEENYRKSHFICEEWVDKRTNVNPPSHPRAYAFGKSRYISEKDVEKIVDRLSGKRQQPQYPHPRPCWRPLPVPVPASSTLPMNILHLDVLSLEFNLLRRAQEQGLPGAPDRRHALTSLGALLQTLQIPVPPFAPLGNAGNDAFYTVLALQKLMMAETRLPELLFSQQPNAYMPYASVPTFSPSTSMAFPQYPALPLPIPIRPSGSRRGSTSSSKLQNDYGLDVSVPPSPSRQPPSAFRGSSATRTRPASIGVDTLQNDAQVRPMRKNMQRSQTVFWDDAEYADVTSTPIKQGQQVRSNSESTKPNPIYGAGAGTGAASSGTETGTSNSLSSEPELRGRTKILASSLRSSSVAAGPSASASVPRNVSWDKVDEFAESRSNDRSRSRQASGTASASGTLGAGDSKRLGASSSSRKHLAIAGSGSGSGSGSRSGTGSRSGSGDHSRLVNNGASNNGNKNGAENGNGGTGAAEGAAGRSGKENKKGERLKSEKSVKNLAGALARFWVG